MTLRQIKDILDADVVSGYDDPDAVVLSACSSDLMSDVLNVSTHKTLLITGLVNLQVVRTAEMMDIHTIVFVRGKKPSPDIKDLASAKNITVMTTDKTMYCASGLLYANGLVSED